MKWKICCHYLQCNKIFIFLGKNERTFMIFKYTLLIEDAQLRAFYILKFYQYQNCRFLLIIRYCRFII